MRIRVYTREHIKQMIAACLLGLVLGLLVGTFILAREVNDLTLENSDLAMKYEGALQQLARLEEQSKHQAEVIKSLEVEVLLKDQYAKLQLEAQIRELLQNLVGQELQLVDPHLVSKIIDGRILNVSEQTFELECKLVWIAPHSFLQIRVVKQDGRPLP